jgi:hypothetical protein
VEERHCAAPAPLVDAIGRQQMMPGLANITAVASSTARWICRIPRRCEHRQRAACELEPITATIAVSGSPLSRTDIRIQIRASA